MNSFTLLCRLGSPEKVDAGVSARPYMAYGGPRNSGIATSLRHSRLSALFPPQRIQVSSFTSQKPLFVFVYVDDFLLIGPKSHINDLDQLREDLKKKYRFRDLGNIQNFLNLRITRDRSRRTLWVTQDTYIEKVVNRFQLESWLDSRIKTPLSSSSLEPPTTPASPETILEYQQKAGSAVYPSVIARPDIAYAASRLCQFMSNPSEAHIKEVNRLLVYLYNTRSLSLCYSGADVPPQEAVNLDPSALTTASDASFADHPDRKSTQGFVISLFGGPIAWQASKQKTVTTSTTEAELLVMSHCAKEIISLMRLFNELRFDPESDPRISCDNSQTVRLINIETPQLTTKLRHVDIHHFWLRQEAQSGRIHVDWVPTDEMPADGFTKSLSAEKHQRFIEQLG